MKPPAGRRMPVNPWTAPAGNVVVLDPEADSPMVRVLAKGEQVPEGEPRYLAHFVTCTNPLPKRKPRR